VIEWQRFGSEVKGDRARVTRAIGV
jgi:hypothetical protein